MARSLKKGPFVDTSLLDFASDSMPIDFVP